MVKLQSSDRGGELFKFGTIAVGRVCSGIEGALQNVWAGAVGQNDHKETLEFPARSEPAEEIQSVRLVPERKDGKVGMRSPVPFQGSGEFQKLLPREVEIADGQDGILNSSGEQP